MPPRGKQGTKGQKQILQENADTLAFYRNMILGVGGIYIMTTFFIFQSIPNNLVDTLMATLSAIAFTASYKFMSSMASPKYSATGSVVDEGCDLNIEGGIAEHIKDLIILTSGCLVLSLISAYFWLLWLLVPARAFQMTWTNILAPYIFQEAPEKESEMSEKKRKPDRKMRRR